MHFAIFYVNINSRKNLWKKETFFPRNLEYLRKCRNITQSELALIELNQLCQSNKDLFAFIDSYEDEVERYIKKIKKEITN